MANLGMLGALGGIGQSLVNEGDYQRRQDEANADMQRRMGLEDWLMQRREAYQIRAEGRAEESSIRAEGRKEEAAKRMDEYGFQKKVERAPTERRIKAEDYVSEKTQELGFQTENLPTIAANKKALTEAGQTDADRALKNANAEYITGAKTSLTEAQAAGKGPESAELKQVQAERSKLQGLVDKAKAAGTWDPKENPGQLDLDNRLRALSLKERTLSGSGASDPFGIRESIKKPAAPQGSMLDGPAPKRNKAEAAMAEQVNGDMGANPETIRREISAVRADLQKVSDPKSKADLEEYLADLLSQQARVSGGAPTISRAPTPKPAAPGSDFGASSAVRTAAAPPSRGLPRSLGEVPGATSDTGNKLVVNYDEAVKRLRERMAQQ